MKTINLGKFDIESGVVRVSDPCYDKSTWCAGTISNVKRGVWVAKAVKSDDNRVSRLVAIHKDHLGEMANWKEEKIDVGVDSGQCGIYDDKYFKDDSVFTERSKRDRRYSEAICDDEPWYSWNCDITLAEPCAGVIPFGCVSSSGYGDGSYVCRTASHGKKVIAIELDYLTELDEIDEEDDIEDEDQE